jgi:Xaa-Pro dipeptidase
MTIDNFPAKEHIRRLVYQLARLAAAAGEIRTEHVIVLQGEHTLSRHDTDRELPFREIVSNVSGRAADGFHFVDQEANFHYATGCLVPSASLIVRFTASDKTDSPSFDVKLCIPEEDAESSMWSVPPPSLKQAKDMFDFDASELGFTGVDDQAWWGSLVNSSQDQVVHVLSTVADGSYPVMAQWMTSAFNQTSKIKVTADHLQRAFHYARLIKTEQEISYIREACRITSGAHEIVMRELGKFAARRQDKAHGGASRRDGKEGLSEWEIESEGDAEAVFVAACRRAGFVLSGFSKSNPADEVL